MRSTTNQFICDVCGLKVTTKSDSNEERVGGFCAGHPIGWGTLSIAIDNGTETASTDSVEDICSVCIPKLRGMLIRT